MKKDLLPLLRSPETSNTLVLESFAVEGDDVIDGRLIDSSTGSWFRIEGGIADLAPLRLRRADKHQAFCARYELDPTGTAQLPSEPMEKGYADQIRFFSEYHDQYEIDVVDSPFYRILDEVTLGAWIRRTLASDALVAEVGCGSGRQTAPLCAHGCRVVGMDLSEEMLSMARRKILSRGGSADFLVASADALPVPAETFDSAIIYGSLHHFPDAARAVAEATKIMKKGGSFYLLEPHASALRPIFDWSMKLWTLWEEEAHDEPLFDREQFEGWLRAGNVEPNIRYSTYLPPHVFHLTGQTFGRTLLKNSDALFGSLPGIRKLAGVIIAEGRKRT